MGNFNTFMQKTAWTLATGIIMGGVSWAGWLTIETVDKVSYEEFNELKNNLPYPYLKDEPWIKREISSLNNVVNNNLAAVIKANTEAIIRLEEQLKYNQKIFERIERKIDNDQQQ